MSRIINKTFPVEGMHCSGCATKVEKTLKTLKGVVDANVNIATEKAYIRYNKDIISIKDISEAVSKAGYNLVVDEEVSDDIDKDILKISQAKNKMLLSLVFIIPATIAMVLDMLSYIHIPHKHIIEVLISFPVIFIIGLNVIKSGANSILHRSANMDVLIAIGVVSSFLTGILIFFIEIESYALVGAMIMTFHLIGRYLEASAKGKASESIKKLLKIRAKTATVMDGNLEKEVEVNDLKIGDVMLIKPGEKIPTDGVVIEGETSVDESIATGESIPVNKYVGDDVIGSTINQVGVIKVKVTKVGKDTFLSQVIKLIEEAQGTKVPIQAFADKVISYFVPSVLIISGVAFLFWLLFPEVGRKILIWGKEFIPWIKLDLNTLSQSLYVAIATLVIACPCALGLSTPTALIVGSGVGAKNGILIKSGEAIQRAKDIDTVVFDKTGTLTYGRPFVTDIFSTIKEREFLSIVFAIEKNSEHPIAKAISEYCKSLELDIMEINYFEAIPGKGIKAKVNGKSYYLGNTRFMEELGLDHKEFEDKIIKLENEGKTIVVLSYEYEIKKELIGIIAVSDIVKPDAKETIQKLKKMGIKTIMLTGDNQKTAQTIANIIEIDEVLPELLPEDKIRAVKILQGKGKVVAVVGDGINDAPSLKQANVGIAIGTGTDIAIESSDITLVREELLGVIRAINLSKATFKKIKQNLFWAFFYNIIAIPIAVLGFLHPLIAEISMAFSSINVITNSLRLKKIDLN